MRPNDEAGHLDLIGLCSLVWSCKWVVALIVVVCVSGGVVFVITATPVYRAEVLLAPNQSGQRSGVSGGLGGLSGLASVAGLSIGAPRDAVQSVATLQSLIFVEGFIEEHDLLPVLFASDWDKESSSWRGNPDEWPTLADGVNFFAADVRDVDEDLDTGLVTLSIEWTDPVIAAEWANQLVIRVNDVLQARDLDNSERRLEYLSDALQEANLVGLRNAIVNVIEEQIQTRMLAQSEEEYAFRVIDPARVATRQFFPDKSRVVLASACFGVLLGMFWSLLQFAIARHRARLVAGE